MTTQKLEQARNALARFGEDSPVFRTWGKIHRDFKNTNPEYGRQVMAMTGGKTVLTIWHGPDVLEQLHAE